MRKGINTFTEGPIFGPLLRFTLPVLLAGCLQALYGAVDLAVVGQFGTAADVSAISTGSQIMHTITYTVTSFSMGTTILLGQLLGQKRQEEAGDTVGGAVCLFMAIAVGITVVMLFAAGPFVRLMKAPEEAYARAVEYVRICSGGAVFIVAYNLLGSIFRGLGDSRTPLLAVAVACVGNILLDLLFVGGFRMGGAGAALATVVSQAISVLLSLLLLRRRKLPFAFSGKNLRFHRAIIGRTCRLGAPVALQDALVSVSFLAILAIVNSLGLTASAGVGVAEKLCTFIMLLPSAFMQSLSAFVAQNIGAKEPGRARRAMGCGMACSLAISVLLFYLSFFHGDLLARIFASDELVIAAAADYLKAYAFDAVLVCLLFCFAGYFNGCGHTGFVMAEGLIGAFGVRIPVSYLMSRRDPVRLFHVGLATPCSTVVQILICAGYFILCLRREKREALRQP